LILLEHRIVHLDDDTALLMRFVVSYRNIGVRRD